MSFNVDLAENSTPPTIETATSAPKNISIESFRVYKSTHVDTPPASWQQWLNPKTTQDQPFADNTTPGSQGQCSSHRTSVIQCTRVLSLDVTRTCRRLLLHQLGTVSQRSRSILSRERGPEAVHTHRLCLCPADQGCSHCLRMERREHRVVDGYVRTNDEATSIGLVAENSPGCGRLESRQWQILGHGTR